MFWKYIYQKHLAISQYFRTTIITSTGTTASNTDSRYRLENIMQTLQFRAGKHINEMKSRECWPLIHVQQPHQVINCLTAKPFTRTHTQHILHSQSLAKNFMAPSGMLNCTINLKHELLINNLAWNGLQKLLNEQQQWWTAEFRPRHIQGNTWHCWKLVHY